MTAKPDPAVSHYQKTVPPKEKSALEQKESAEHKIGPEREHEQKEAARKAGEK